MLVVINDYSDGVGVYRLHRMNGRVYVVNGEGEGVNDFDSYSQAEEYVREVMRRQRTLLIGFSDVWRCRSCLRETRINHNDTSCTDCGRRYLAS